MTSVETFLQEYVPTPVHRLILRLGRGVRLFWRRIHYRPSEGCAVIVQNEKGHVLLVRHTYVEPDTWMLPAGKMKRREAPVAAAEREMKEEINCGLRGISLLEFEDKEFWGRRHTTFIIGAVSDNPPEPDLREIEEAAFFPLSNLPASLSEPTADRLDRWKVRNSIPFSVPPFIRVDYVRGSLSESRQA